MPPKYCQPAMACFSLLLLLQLLQLPLLAVVLLIISCCSSTLQYAGAASAAHHHHRPMQNMVQVQGLVFCDACRESRFSNFSLPIPGATILLTCKTTRHPSSTSTPFTTKASSDKYGAFSFDIPFSKPTLLRKCTVELTNSPFPACTTQTRFSRRAIAPIFRVRSKGSAHLSYLISGWLSYQPKSIPSFCRATPREGFTQNGHSAVGHSKDTALLPEDFPFPNFFPPLPGTPTPTFPFNFFPPLPNVPGLTPPTSPFNVPPVPGFPPFPQFPPFPNFPGFPPFPSYPFPFPFPFSFPSPRIPSPFPSFPPFPPLGIPPNPLPPSISNNPFTTPTPSSNVPPLQLPPLPPGLSVPPYSPNPLSPSTPTEPLNSPSPLLPPFQFPNLPPGLQFPPFSPIPLPPSNPTTP